MNKKFFFLAVTLGFSVLIALGATVIGDNKATNEKEFATLSVGEQQYTVEVARTRAAQEQGLSNRDAIGADGMLFVFQENQDATFWMKGMRFALDIVWIRGGVVTGIDQNVPPPAQGEDPAVRTSPGAISYVLELPAGGAGAFSVGDPVSLNY